MPKRKVDPLGRNHQTVQKPTNRPQVDRVCFHVMDSEKRSFMRNPSALHIYYDAYTVIYGSTMALEMLKKARQK